MITVADAAPLWPDEWIGIGTVVLAALTLAAVVTTIWITVADRRRGQEREASARDKEQEADAWAVQVQLADVSVRGTIVNGAATSLDKALMVTVTNLGSRPITRLRVEFWPSGSTRLGYERAKLRRSAIDPREPDLNNVGYPGVVPTGSGMQFSSVSMAPGILDNPYVKVWWHDHLGQEWLYERGHVRKAQQAAEIPRT